MIALKIFDNSRIELKFDVTQASEAMQFNEHSKRVKESRFIVSL